LEMERNVLKGAFQPFPSVLRGNLVLSVGVALTLIRE
jgi:hypothetical protein